MRRALPLLCLFALFATIPALALPGPDPVGADEQFNIVVLERARAQNPPPPDVTYDNLEFHRSDGWDFGDRDSYNCAYVERFDAQGHLLLELDFELNADYQVDPNDPGTVALIDDRGGMEVENKPKGSPDTCGDTTTGTVPYDGSDHHPHFVESSDPTTHGVRIYGTQGQPGVLDTVATDSFNATFTAADCDRGYWTPGDEPGELWLWWDPDFPENGHADGSQPLDCGGGGGEPFAVVRLHFTHLAPGVGVCILDHDVTGGKRCMGMTEPPPSPPPSPSPPSPTCTPNPKTGECKPPKA